MHMLKGVAKNLNINDIQRLLYSIEFVIPKTHTHIYIPSIPPHSSLEIFPKTMKSTEVQTLALTSARRRKKKTVFMLT